MTLPVPSVGRIVLYKSRGKGQISPAIIVEVEELPIEPPTNRVRLVIFGIGNGSPAAESDLVKLDQSRTYDNTWSWMDYQVQTVGQRYPDAPKEAQ